MSYGRLKQLTKTKFKELYQSVMTQTETIIVIRSVKTQTKANHLQSISQMPLQRRHLHLKRCL